MTSIAVIKQQGDDLAQDIKDLVIFDNETFEVAGALLSGIKGYLKRIDEITDPVIEAAKANLAAARDQKRLLAEPAEAAEKILKKKLADYDSAVADRVREAQARVLAERQQAQDEADLGASLSGEASEPVFVPDYSAPVFEKPKAAGIGFRTDWAGECHDLMALIKAIADGKAPLELVQVNQAELNKRARMLREALNFPGVRAVSKRTVTSKAAQ